MLIGFRGETHPGSEESLLLNQPLVSLGDSQQNNFMIARRRITNKCLEISVYFLDIFGFFYKSPISDWILRLAHIATIDCQSSFKNTQMLFIELKFIKQERSNIPKKEDNLTT